MKYRSEFKHGFTNRDCLQCAILKVLHGVQEKKSPNVKGYAIFSIFFKIFQMRFSKFSKCLKTTLNSPERPAELTQISSRRKNATLIMFLFCYYC